MVLDQDSLRGPRMGRGGGRGNENVCSSKHAKQSRPHMLTRSHLHLGTGSKVAQEFYICYSNQSGTIMT